MEQSLLSHYGDCIAIYTGKGTLTFPEEQPSDCTFEAGQLRDGGILLICDFLTPPSFSPFLLVAQNFEGVTVEGFRVSTAGQLFAINDLTSELEASPGIRLAFYVSQMTIQMDADISPKQVRFGITNLMLDKPLSLSLQDATSKATLTIEPLAGYERIMTRVRTLKAIDVTCEVIINSAENVKELERIVDNLCYLLSVARGTKIQWIYWHQYNECGELLSEKHSSNVTKAFCPLSIIEGKEHLKIFIESTYTSYVKNCERYSFASGLIDAYLDAKAEKDYLQVRAVKLAVTMEMLKDVFLKLEGVIQGGESILDQKTFHAFKSLIESPLRYVLTILGVDAGDQDAICNKLEELNRKSFKPILQTIFKYIGLDIAKRDLDLFVTCRNRLIHTGRFFSETATKKDFKRYKLSFEWKGVEEYYFLVSVLDKVFLKLLGYSGRYIERQLPGQGTLSHL